MCHLSATQNTFTMLHLKFYLFILTLYGLILFSDALVCPKGHRIVVQRLSRKESCEECRSGYFQHKENDSQDCEPCTKCDEASGSFTETACTRTSNTICKCRAEFVYSDDDFSTCHCKAGFGKTSGECTQCQHGYFSSSINSQCKKWKECKSGINIPGTSTSDVICKETPKTETRGNASPPPHILVTANTGELLTTTTAATTTTTTTATDSPTRQIEVQAPSPSNTTDPKGFLFSFATVGLLMLTAVIIGLYITLHTEKPDTVQTHESLCGRPVEEIGGGSQVSLKLNAEENSSPYLL